MKIEIKNRFSGSVIFSHEVLNNTIAITLIAAISAGADLSRADLSRADLYGADLYGADLYGANLSRADLYGADLYGANLSRADLSGANLSGANLYGANLSGADLSRADLSGADLSRANLYGANLYGANLYELKNAELPLARTLITPQVGSFVGWKKLKNGVIAQLVIVHDAKRFNSYGSRKCRASAVVVHAMWKDGKEFNGVEYDKHTGKTKYEVGATVLPDSFNEDRCIECANGIHFFLTKEEAEAY